MSRPNPAITVRRSTGNVFADLGLPQPDEALAKAELVRRIAATIGDRGWTQARAATALGVDQAKVSALLRGQLGGFSTERLLRFLNALGCAVEIVVHPAPGRLPRTTTAATTVRDA
jgi:predicted XRE-type DNA-binding protein